MHQRVAYAHGVDGEEEDAHAELEVALDAAEEEVEREQSVAFVLSSMKKREVSGEMKEREGG